MRNVVLGFAMVAGALVPISAHATAITVGKHYIEGSDRKSRSVPSPDQCLNGSTCNIIFNLIPTGKQLLVTDVSCHIEAHGADSNAVHFTGLATFNGSFATDRVSYFEPKRTLTSATNTKYIAEGKVRHAFKAGERPVIMFKGSGTITWDPRCSIAGSIGNPPD